MHSLAGTTARTPSAHPMLHQRASETATATIISIGGIRESAQERDETSANRRKRYLHTYIIYIYIYISYIYSYIRQRDIITNQIATVGGDDVMHKSKELFGKRFSRRRRRRKWGGAESQ